MTTTAPDMTALWLAVEEMPACRLTRGVYADALEESGEYDLACACRATADKWPVCGTWCYWWKARSDPRQRPYWIAPEWYARLRSGTKGRFERTDLGYRQYDTARDALYDLWRAWVTVNRVN